MGMLFAAVILILSKLFFWFERSSLRPSSIPSLFSWGVTLIFFSISNMSRLNLVGSISAWYWILRTLTRSWIFYTRHWNDSWCLVCFSSHILGSLNTFIFLISRSIRRCTSCSILKIFLGIPLPTIWTLNGFPGSLGSKPAGASGLMTYCLTKEW